jgi:simple sugar transport system permease protein
LTAVLAVIVAYGLFTRHKFGFSVRLAGQSPRAAGFAGVNANRLIILCMLISGGLAGLAGVFEVTGPAGQITTSFGSYYGFTAIIVAFLGRLHPVGILFAGLLMALTYIGGDAAQSTMNLPSAAIQIFQGMLLFYLLAADVLINFRIKRTRSEAA